jgi:protein gp37
MSQHSKIEWTDSTWNPVTGCSKVSEGCMNCYAERLANRLQAMHNPRYLNGFEVTLHEDLLDIPLKWSKPRMIFVNSMSDLFHESIPLEFIEKVFATMQSAKHHIFQVLTKRSERLLELSPFLSWPSNLWVGVSVESNRYFHRIHQLAHIPGTVSFISCEPLLGPMPDLPVEHIDWVIVGGESGPHARKMKKEWVEAIKKQCQENSVPFFFKQWGGVRKDLSGRMLNGQYCNELPVEAYRHESAPSIFGYRE